MADRPRLLQFEENLPAKPQFGERLRLRIVQGKALGRGYVLMSDKVILGRDEDCDLPVDDDKASRRHVELSWKKDRYFARDLDSANGLLINKKRVKGAFLESGDLITVGNTVLEVVAPGKKSQLAIPDEVLKEGREAAELSDKERQLRSNRAKVMIFVFVLFMMALGSSEKILTFREKAYVWEDQAQSRKRQSKKDRKEAKKLIREFKPTYQQDTPGFKQAHRFYRLGMRELNGKNYRRAIAAFETAITVDPKHELARIYRDIAADRLRTEISAVYRDGVRAWESKRYKEARMHFSNVIRLLEKEPENPLYEKSKQLVEEADRLSERAY